MSTLQELELIISNRGNTIETRFLARISTNPQVRSFCHTIMAYHDPRKIITNASHILSMKIYLLRVFSNDELVILGVK